MNHPSRRGSDLPKDSESLIFKRASNLRKKICLSLAIVHLAAVCLCFGAAILRPERSGLAPVMIWLADIPASLAIEPIRHALHGLTDGYTNRLLIDASVYALLGTCWWILVGMAIAWIIGSWRASLRDGTTI